MLTLTQIENALLALPTFAGRDRFDEAVKAAVVCCACTQIGTHTDKLAAFTGYEAKFIHDCLVRLRERYFLLTGTLSLSELSTLIPKSSELVARLAAEQYAQRSSESHG